MEDDYYQIILSNLLVENFLKLFMCCEHETIQFKYAGDVWKKNATQRYIQWTNGVAVSCGRTNGFETLLQFTIICAKFYHNWIECFFTQIIKFIKLIN